MRRALVLGAGGSAACAWEIGLIVGMEEAGLDVRNADLFVGTSAGARVAAQLTSGMALEDLFQVQLTPGPQAIKPAPAVDFQQWRNEIARAKQGGGDNAQILRRMGLRALATSTDPALARRQFLASQLPIHTWPAQRLSIVAVDAETGERTAFDSASGIDLLDAVMASGAVAGIYPPVAFRGHHYFDGGFYSIANADLAVGFGRVLILTLRASVPPLSLVALETAVDRLRGNGARVEVIHPDEATEAAFASVGGNLLNPAVAEPAARAGRAQGRRVASERVVSLWG